MRTTFILSLAAGLLLTASAAADIRLREQARPSGDTVTLGDLFEGLERKADIVVGPAPAPGNRSTFQIKHIVALARIHELGWQPTGKEGPVVVARDGRRFKQSDVLNRLRAELRARGLNETYEIDLAGRTVGVDFAKTGADLLIRELELDQGSGRFSASLVVLSTAGEPEYLPLNGRIQSISRIPVVMRVIRRGETITAEDVGWTEVRLAPGMHGILTTAEDMIGQAARRTLRPNTPLQQADLTAPIIVRKGSLVTMSLEAPGLALTSTGRALEDASMGDAVKVMNPQSKRTVETTVVGPAQVRVRLRRQFAVAANQ